MKARETSKSEPERLVIGLTGASGVAYGIRALEALRDLGIESHLVMTKPAEMTIGYETALSPKQVAAKADFSYAVTDIAAPIASGSFRTKGMLVGMISSPCPRHSAAMAEANFSVGRRSEFPLGVLIGLPSSSTAWPPSCAATETSL